MFIKQIKHGKQSVVVDGKQSSLIGVVYGLPQGTLIIIRRLPSSWIQKENHHGRL